MSSDKIGGTSSEMKAAEKNFRDKVLDFDNATQNIRLAVQNLADSWFGGGYDAFCTAMSTWDKDMLTIKDDLTGLSDAVSSSDSGFQSLDQDIANKFKGFQK